MIGPLEKLRLSVILDRTKLLKVILAKTVGVSSNLPFDTLAEIIKERASTDFALKIRIAVVLAIVDLTVEVLLLSIARKLKTVEGVKSFLSKLECSSAKLSLVRETFTLHAIVSLIFHFVANKLELTSMYTSIKLLVASIISGVYIKRKATKLLNEVLEQLYQLQQSPRIKQLLNFLRYRTYDIRELIKRRTRHILAKKQREVLELFQDIGLYLHYSLTEILRAILMKLLSKLCDFCAELSYLVAFCLLISLTYICHKQK